MGELIDTTSATPVSPSACGNAVAWGNAGQLRAGLQALGLNAIGDASPIVPFVIGETDLARLLYRSMKERGAVVNLVEFPAVARDAARMRLQVMSEHSAEHIGFFLGVVEEALEEARGLVACNVKNPLRIIP